MVKSQLGLDEQSINDRVPAMCITTDGGSEMKAGAEHQLEWYWNYCSKHII